LENSQVYFGDPQAKGYAAKEVMLLGEAGKQVQMMNQILGEAGRFRRCEFRQG
jgi:hypothetical protein